MTETSTRDQVAALLKKDPTLSLAEIGRRVGVSPARVGQLMEAMGYEWRAEWRKAKGGAK